MPLNDQRRSIVKKIVLAAIASATPASFLLAATRKSAGPIPLQSIHELADGRKVEIVQRGDALMARVLDPNGRGAAVIPVGKLKLKSGKTLTFDKTGRLTQGEFAERSFVLICDDPPAPCPPK